MENKRINDLLEQYVNKTISEQDFATLFEYISKDDNKIIIEAYMRQSDKIVFPDIEAHHVDWQHMYNNIISGKKEKSKLSKTISIASKLAVAASLMLAAYIGFNRNTDKQKVQNAKSIIKNDVLPGGDKAVLKLADGSQIVLNEQQNGQFALQGNSTVSKNNEGYIEYKNEDKADEQKVFTNILSTPRGGQYKMMLPDQTMVWLNAESSITFPTAFIGKERRVQVSGEVYFEVSKNKDKPFIVESNKASIEVLGTHFNVMAYPNELQSAVTLLEGSVKVSKEGNSKVIVPGQQALFTSTGNNISLRNIEVDNVIDWKNGLFIFEEANLPEVMRQIERWYNVDVEYTGKVPEIKFTGIISRNNNVSKIIKLLEKAGNIDFEIENKTIRVKSLSK